MRMPMKRRERRGQQMRPIRSLFDDFLKNTFYEPADDERVMAIDVVEKEKEFILTANLPGIKKENIKVYVDGSDLVIEGHQKEEKKTDDENLYQCERYQGNYKRMLSIPDNWDCDKINAKYDNGVLKLKIPKKEPEPEKLIDIS